MFSNSKRTPQREGKENYISVSNSSKLEIESNIPLSQLHPAISKESPTRNANVCYIFKRNEYIYNIIITII